MNYLFADIIEYENLLTLKTISKIHKWLKHNAICNNQRIGDESWIIKYEYT